MTEKRSDLPTTQAFLSERESLDEALRVEYDALVQDYRYYAVIHHNHPFVSYKVLADLVRAGWKRPA